MSFNKKLTHWAAGEGPENDIVISSRVRLARNIEDLPYPNKADNESLKSAMDNIKKTAVDTEDFQLHFIDMNELPEIEKKLLVEKHLISPPHAKGGHNKATLLNDKENISIMINEEDHLRLQVILPGMQLNKTWQKADYIDDIFESDIDFAFSKKWGYLSACPTNMGTGMRASVMVHLPALNMTNNIEKMLGAVSQLGLAVRGIYGEGSESAGNIYQISNQITLGQSEQDILENINSVSTQIVEQERQARKSLLQNHEIEVIDRIKRSYGALKFAHIISNNEALELLSNVRLGIDMEIIKDVDPGVLSELMILIRPAHLQKNEGEELSPREINVKRAELIQQRLEI